MLNILKSSNNELLKNIRFEQKLRIETNREQVKNYILQKTFSDYCENNTYRYEKKIVFMIKYFVSLKFIAKYFNISEKYIKEIALKNKCQSQLLSSYTENPETRCFTRSQILRASEEFNYICPMCFKPLDITNINSLTGHHIQPFAKNGKTIKENCLPLHINCHFENFKLLHSVLFNSDNPIYSAKYFNIMKEKLQKEKSGIEIIMNQIK